MKKIKMITACIFIAAGLLGCGAEKTDTDKVTKDSSDTEKSLYDRGLEVIDLMAEMVHSDTYVDKVVGNGRIKELIKSVGEGSYDEPAEVYAVSQDDESFDILMEMAGMDDSMSEELKSFLTHRGITAIISSANTLDGEGVEPLAAANICTAEKIFADDSISEDIIYIYTFENGYPAAVAFRTGEDNAVAATGTFIISDDFAYGSEDEIEASFEKIGVAVDAERLTGNAGQGETAETKASANEEEMTEEGAAKPGEKSENTGDDIDIGAEKAEDKASDSKELFPYIDTKYLSEYRDVGELLASVEYDLPGIRNKSEDYAELKAALEAYGNEREADAEAVYARILEAAKADAEFSESFSGYSSESNVEILRADERVFSFSDEGYDYTGGAHGNGNMTGVSFDTRTGKRLGISDVVTDKNALSDYIIADLNERFEADGYLFEGWEDTVRNEPEINFAMADDCMKVYFAPYLIGPYALGTVTVDVPYDEASIGFKAEYLPVGERSVWQISAYEELPLDIDGDGALESIRYELYDSDAGDYMKNYTVFVSDGEKQISAGGDCYYGINKAYIMKAPSGKYMFCGEFASDNDWRDLTVLDLTALCTGETGEDVEPSRYPESFYENVPVSSEGFCLETRGNLLSTVMITKEYSLGDDGMPKALSDVYSYNDFSITAKRELTGEAVTASGEPKGEEVTIPAGTVLNAVSTDEKEYVILQSADTGELVRLKVSGDWGNWPHTIDGTDIEELFDGLIFAG